MGTVPWELGADQPILDEGEHLGFRWISLRGMRPNRNGYVEIPVGHPWYELIKKDNYSFDEVRVHGGITYAEVSEFDGSRWIGFDTGHSGDACDPELGEDPGEKMMSSIEKALGLIDRYSSHAVIRTKEYVREQCESLCSQAFWAQIETQGEKQ